jgi:signal peptidase II
MFKLPAKSEKCKDIIDYRLNGILSSLSSPSGDSCRSIKPKTGYRFTWLQTNLPSTGLFRLTHAQNTGAAFSIFYGKSGILTIVVFIGIILLLFYAFVVSRRFPFLDTRLNKISLALILGGTVGNLIDRLRLGHVTDFIDVGPWPVFNVADSSIFVGVLIFALSILLTSHVSEYEHHQ